MAARLFSRRHDFGPRRPGGEPRGALGVSAVPGLVCCRSAVLPTALTFLVILASGGLLVLLETGMLSGVETPAPHGPAARPDLGAPRRPRPAAADMDAQIIQEIRNRTIRSMCGHRNVPNNIWSLSEQQRKTLLDHILVSDEYRFLYCYVPKVACPNWKRILKILNGVIRFNDFTSRLDHHSDLLPLSSLKPDEIRHRLDRYFKFMFVREPMERLLSAYRNKFGEVVSYQKSFGSKIIKRYRKVVNVKGDDVTLTEFIQYLLDTNKEAMNEHWMPIYNLCQPCAVSYDFIGSHEHLERDAEYVLQRVGAPPHVRYPDRQAWYKPVTAEMVHYYLCTVPQKLLGDLFSKYILDFSLFGYSLPNTTNEHCRH